MDFVADVVSDKSMLANQCLLHKNFVGWGGGEFLLGEKLSEKEFL